MEGQLANVAGALLLGGSSSRMGRDKAGIEFDGRSLAERTAGLLSTLCEDVVLVGGSPPAGAPGRVVADPGGPACALRGLVGALEATDRERVLVLATDLPLLEPPLLLALLAWPLRDAVVPRSADGSHPLCALYRREPTLEAARQRMSADDLSLRGLLELIATDWLEGEHLAAVDPDGRMLTNVNSPEELAALRAGGSI